jgi:hypothetical protein
MAHAVTHVVKERPGPSHEENFAHPGFEKIHEKVKILVTQDRCKQPKNEDHKPKA